MEYPSVLSRLVRRTYFTILALGVSLVVWGQLAPLATTLRVPGALGASSPSFTLQHPSGGRVQTVFVKRHEKIAKGQRLLQIDVSGAQVKLDALGVEGRFLQAEIAHLTSRLQRGSFGGPVKNEEARLTKLKFDQADLVADFELSNLAHSRQALVDKKDVLRLEISVLEEVRVPQQASPQLVAPAKQGLSMCYDRVNGHHRVYGTVYGSWVGW
jgi:multidrug efflux pump subunit AcrA (membrane-fusion protein)